MAASPLCLSPADTCAGSLAAPFSLPVILTRLRRRQMQEWWGEAKAARALATLRRARTGPLRGARCSSGMLSGVKTEKWV